MNSASIALRSQSPVHRVLTDRAPALIALAFLVLHALLAATVDAADPGVFLRVDRAQERILVMQGLLAVGSTHELLQYLGSHGIVGDYAVHAALYLVGGPVAIVFTQIVLALLSGIAVHRLGVLLGLSRGMCSLAMIVYLCLPHTLVFPHQLATEALHTPLFVISNLLLAEGLRRTSGGLLPSSAVCLAAATLIRPITLLWPLLAGVVVAISKRARDGVTYVCVAMLPVAAWMLFIGAQTGHIGLGESGHSMERNLYERVVRISATMPPAERAAARATYLNQTDRTLSPIAYLRFSAAQPLPVLRHLARDSVAFFAKSGVERITIDYLAVVPGARTIQSTSDGWRRQWELHGAAHTASYLWDKLGPALLVSVAGSLVMVTLVGLALIGAVHFLKRWRDLHNPEVLLGLTLAAVVLYTFAFSQVLNAMQSRQRAPAEFALVLLAVAGLSVLRWRRKQTKRQSAPSMKKAVSG